MKNSKVRRLCITIGIVIGLALSVLILSIIGQEGQLKSGISKTGKTPINDTKGKLTIVGDGDCLIVNIYGTGTATYRLTMAVLDVSIQNPNPSMSLEKTYSNIIDTGNHVITILKKYGLKVESKNIIVQPYYTYGRKLLGYVISYHIVASTYNVSSVREVLPYLVNSMISLNLKFTANRTVISRAYRTALKYAIENAIEKLDVIARELNMTKIVIVNIREGSMRPIIVPLYSVNIVKTSQPSIYVPSGEVSATVYVTARLCR
ncbi:MAG: SIMPL domain-containing protein [Crenarchaeota archaeon]|nr:SIMPL domain-containing protein [Thermoproteota archaeon]